MATDPRSATDKVIGTQELLEQVLLSLDMKTLLLAQRVSHLWKATIENKRELQIKLFFAPATEKEAWTICLDVDSVLAADDEYLIANPLLLFPGDCGEDEAEFLVRPEIAQDTQDAECETRSWSRMLYSQPPTPCFDAWPVLEGNDLEPEDLFWADGLSNWAAPSNTTLYSRLAYANRSAADYGVTIAWDSTQISIGGLASFITGRTMLKVLDERKRGLANSDISCHFEWVRPAHEHGRMELVECGKAVGDSQDNDCCIETRRQEQEAKAVVEGAVDGPGGVGLRD